MHSRRYSAFVSYRHADNKEMGRKWANWLHAALESYEVPPDLIGTTNQRGDQVPASLYPVFRDEEELPADADLSTNIRRALENSGLLVVLCSPRAVQSRFVADEIRYFKELGHSHRILALMIDGEPNASDDPAKRETYGPDAECFPEPLRFGVASEDNPKHIDWTARTEPIAADVRPAGRADQGWTTAAAYDEQLQQSAKLTPDQRSAAVRDYAEHLELAKLKVIAGALGVPLGLLTQRDKVMQLARAQQRAKVLRRWLVAVGSLTMMVIAAAWYASRQAAETNRQLERSQVEEGRAWLERAIAATSKGDHLGALMLAGRAVGYQGYGRHAHETTEFSDQFPLLLAKPMKDPAAEKNRREEADKVSDFLDSIQPTHLPVWAGPMSNDVTCVAFSPDGTRVASGSGDKEIKIWNAATGEELASLKGHTGGVAAVAFSPEGSNLASGSQDKTIKLWDATTGQELQSLKGHKGRVTSVAFSPDGSRLASGATDKAVKVWNAAGGQELASFQGHSESVTCVAFDSEGLRLASGSDDSAIKIWDVTTGKELASLQGHTNKVWCVSFSPDGTRLASGSDDNTIKLWDATTGKEIASLHGHTKWVTSVAFSPDGRQLASGSGDKTIKFWSAATGAALTSLQGHRNTVTGVTFSPDGTRLVSGSWDKTTKLWDVSPRKDLTSFQGHENGVMSVAFSPEGTRLASGSQDKMIKLWDVVTGKELATLHGHAGPVGSVAFSPDGNRLASGSYDRTITIWDAITGKAISSLKGHTNRVESIAFSPDGKHLASGSRDKTNKLWDVATGKELATLKGHGDWVWCVAFNPDGTRLASGSNDNTIKLWDAVSGKELASFQGYKRPVTSVGFSPDGTRLASGSDDATIELWDLSTGKKLADPPANDLAIAEQWLAASQHRLSPDHLSIAEPYGTRIFVVSNPQPTLDLAGRLRAKLLALPRRELQFPDISQPTFMVHVRQDTLAQLADPKLTPERRAELRMELCAKSSQFRAATALWQRLSQGEWPGFEGATVPKDQAPATIPADSPIRCLYLLALIGVTKHPQIHGHLTICQTAAQIVPVLTKEMMATPTISLAMMSLMQTLAKDDSPDMSAPRATLMKRLEEVAAKEWLAVLRESGAGKNE